MTQAARPSIAENPYRGLVPFSEEDEPFFFGRDHDRDVITDNLMATRLTLLYGTSGVGKSSVLRAGVAHRLREEAEQNLKERGSPEFGVVVFSAWKNEPLSGLLEQTQKYVSVLQSRSGAAASPLVSNGAITSPRAVSPSAFVDRLRELAASVGELFVILDQFEEYFLYHPRDDGDRGFAAQFADALTRRDLPVHFLISIREDSLARLDKFEDSVPKLFGNLLRIEHLDRAGSEEAIRGPLAVLTKRMQSEATPFAADDALVKAVLDQVGAGQVRMPDAGRGTVALGSEDGRRGIETSYLQLVLRRLWLEERKANSRTLRLDTFNRLGGVGEIVRTHLDSVMQELTKEEQTAAAKMFQYLVTPSGSKIAHTSSDLAGYAKLPEDATTRILERLASGSGGARIVRPVEAPPDAAQVARYEIFHDMLAPAVLDWRKRHFAELDRVAIKRKAEEAQHRAEREAKQLAKQLQQEAEAARRLTSLKNLLTVILILAVAVGVFATVMWIKARQRKIAVIASLHEAEESQKKTEESQRIAEAQAIAYAALTSVAEDPERGLLLGLEAFSTFPKSLPLPTQVEAALHRGLQSSRVALTLATGTEQTASVAFSTDGSLIATGDDKGARVWSSESGIEKAHLKEPASVTAVTFTPDGRGIALGTTKGTVALWDVEFQDKLQTFNGHTDRISGLVFFSKGEKLATSSRDGRFRLCEVSSGECKNLRSDSAPILSLDVSRDGALGATGSKDGMLRLLSLPGGTTLFEWSEKLADQRKGTKTREDKEDEQRGGKMVKPISAVALNPSASILAAGVGHDIRIFDLATKTERKLTGHRDAVAALTFDEPGQRLASASFDKVAIVWKVDSGEPLVRLEGDRAPLQDVHFDPRGKRLLTGGDKPRLWTLGDFSETTPLVATRLGVSSLVFSKDARHILSAHLNGSVILWDVESRSWLHFFSNLPQRATAAFSPDSRWIASASSDGVTGLRSTTTREWVTLATPARESERMDGASEVRFSQDGALVGTGGPDNRAFIWDTETQQRLHMLEHGAARVTDLSFDSPHHHLATSSDDGTVRFWDLGSGHVLRALSVTGIVTRVAFNPAGSILAAGSRSGDIVMWNVDGDHEPTRRPQTMSHPAEIVALTFAPEGRKLATASVDRIVKIWDVESGKLLSTFSNYEESIGAVAFSPDGKQLAVGTNDGRIWLYPLEPQELVRLGVARVSRSLEKSECRQLLGKDCTRTSDSIASLLEGKQLAQAHQMDAAMAALKKASEENSSWGIDPELMAQRLSQEVHLARGLWLAEKGQIDSAARAYEDAVKTAPKVPIPAGRWNSLCWWGALHDRASVVIDACNKAVEISGGGSNYHDSRGVARALLSDTQGAIADFEVFAATGIPWERPDRKRWIAELRAGRKPFTAFELKRLRDE
ncbi:MAG: hypothetical protein ABW133_02135 [Polyangiaceae bacterium]